MGEENQQTTRTPCVVQGDWVYVNTLTKEQGRFLLTVGSEVQKGKGVWRIRHNARSTVAMNTVGIDAPSRVELEYDYPRPPDWDVRNHQRMIVDTAVRHTRAYILAGMGSGKTASLAWATDYLKKQGMIDRVLIICPLSVLYDAWLKTIPMLFLGRRSILPIHGAKKVDNIAKDADYHVINFDGVHNLLPELLKQQWSAIIIDESIKMKNANSKRTKAVATLLRNNVRYAWQLTGKPTPQSPLDAYGQLKLFNKFKHSYKMWQNLTQFPVTEHNWVNREGWQDTVYSYMQPAIHVATRDCIDLPDLVRIQREVALTKPQKMAIKALREDHIVQLGSNMLRVDNSAVLRVKLLQITNGAVRTGEDEDTVQFDMTDRMSVVADCVEQAESKTIVFAPFKAVVGMIADQLIKDGYRVGVITGATSADKRQQIFDSFQSDDDGSVQVIVAIPHAMAHGVTLTNASMMVWYSPIDSNDIYRQAIARMERMGQTRKMVMVEIWGSPIEKAMYNLLNVRDSEQEAFLDKYKDELDTAIKEM